MAGGMFDFGNSSGNPGAGFNLSPPGLGGGMFGNNSSNNNYSFLQKVDNSPSGSSSYSPFFSPNGGSMNFGGGNGYGFFPSGQGGYSGNPIYQSAYNYNPGTNLTSAFGNLGPYIMNMIQTGGYNPAVFNAQVQQQMPYIQEAISTIGANTGASGTRFGSGYSLALGDYLGQVNNNFNALAAQDYQQSVQNSLAALGMASQPMAQAKANSGSWWKQLLGTAAQVGLGFATGGLSSLAGLAGGIGDGGAMGSLSGLTMNMTP
jgi:hypothetical protein